MTRMHARLAAALTWVAAGIFAPAAASGPEGRPGQAPAAPAVDRQQVLEVHSAEGPGGSAAAGRPLYDKQCAGCHRFGGIGKDVGPDLTTLTSRFKKKDVMEAILWPSKIISDQYQAEMLQMTDGSIVTGVLVRENATAVLIRTGENPEKPVVVQKAQIATRAPSTVSLMPEGLIDALGREEVANLLAFLMAPPPEK